MAGDNLKYIIIGIGAIFLAVPVILLRGRNRLVFILLATALVTANEVLTEFNIEKTHIPLYALLSYTVHKSEIGNIFVTLVICSVLGVVEEWSQQYIPDRFYDPRDLFLNVLGVFFGLAFALLIRNERGPEID